METTTLNGYRKLLKDSLSDSKILLSISTLPPERWIRENHIGSEYRKALFKKIYDKTEKFENKRITIVNNKEHFDEFFREPIIEFAKTLNNRFYKYYFDQSEISNKEKNLINKIWENLNGERNEILKDIFAVFATIHSRIENSKILWKDGKILCNLDLLHNCLGAGDEREGKLTEYDELLIYTDKVLKVKHEINAYYPKSKDPVKYEFDCDIEGFTDSYHKLFDIIEVDYLKNQESYGCSLRKYVEKLVDNNFWESYENWEKLNFSIKHYVELCFKRTREEENNKIINGLQDKILEIIDTKNDPETTEKVFGEIEIEELKNKIKVINNISQLHNIKDELESLPNDKLNKFLKTLL